MDVGIRTADRSPRSCMNATALTLLLALGTSFPAVAGEEAPVTPAERQFRAWLAAFNGGDRVALSAFLDSAFAARGAGPNQQFRAVAEGGGQYHFVAVHSGKCVEVPEPAAAGLVQLQQRTCDGTAAQSFRVAPTTGDDAAGITTDRLYTLMNKSSGRCVEAAAAGAGNGTAVRQSACNGTDAQVWRFIATSGDRYKIQAQSDATLGWDVAGGPGAVGDAVKIQLWRNVPDAEGELGFRERTGGFDFRKAEESSTTRFTGLLQERDSDQFARFAVEVEPDEPHRITRLDLQAVPRPPGFAVPRLTESDLPGALREQLGKDAASDKFAGAVIVARSGRTVFSGAYGLADRDRKIPNTLHTRFRIGSMNKMFTATAALQLVESGRIKLEDPVGRYLTDYPNKEIADKVTIHQLLTHTGGTGDIFGPEFDAHRLELRTLQDYVKLYSARGPAFEPGSRWEYSNYGMLLLGVVIEKVSGVSYYDYVRNHIFEPAGMTATGSLAEDEVVSDRSIGYMKRDGVWKPNTDTLPYRGTSAGGGYSTVEDLVRFAAALTSNVLLDARHTEILTTGKVETPGRGKYAYGFNDTIDEGVRSFGHGGGAPGMNGDLRIYPKSGYVIAVLSNLDPPAAGRVSQFVSNRLPLSQEK
jgi:D-alanyl-D-alanine carboxypeptidase